VSAVVETPVTFWYVVTTILVLPALYALYIMVEFNLHEAHIGKFFPFLKNAICKGVYLIMLALMINDVQQTVEIIFLICISALAIVVII